jgi:hypothetical protein
MNQELLIFIGGILHFGILLASAMVPKVLDWNASLEKLDGLFRQLVWVHGVFIVFVIVGFGLLSITCAADLASGTPLARAVCLFVALFWGASASEILSTRSLLISSLLACPNFSK